jgi:hypothetical protein
MARGAALVVIGMGAWLSVGLLGGCNEILDIEQANLVASTSSAGGGTGTIGDADTCTKPNNTCSDCISANCSPPDQSQCTEDPACRKASDHYARCLGPACKANETECFEPLFAGDAPVPTCVIQNCGAACASVPVYSACQLYCGCMLTDCQGKFDTFPACMAACNMLDTETVNCRRTHCEIAPFDKSLPHCDHAMGIITCLSADVPVRSSDCRNKSLKGFYCEADSDCCSMACDKTKKACGNP